MKLFTRVDMATTKATLVIFRQEVRHDSRRLMLAMILIPLGTTLVTVVTPLLLSLIIQHLVTSPHNLTPVYYLVGGIGLSAVLTIALNDRGFRWLFNHEEYISTRLTNRATSHLLSRSHGFFADHKVGTLTGDVIAFSRSYMSMTDSFFLQAVAVIVNIVASLVVVAIISPILLIPLILLTGGVILLSIRALNKRSALRNERKRLSSKLNGTIADIIGNSLLVRIFARRDTELSTVATERDRIAEITRREVSILQTEADFRYVVLYSFQIITMLLGIWLFAHGNVTIAALIFTVTYLGRITGSLFNITGFIRQIEQAFLDASPITKIMNEDIEITDAPDARELHVTKGAITLKDVGFAYSDNDTETVFNHLDLTIPAGQRIGLAGHSGGGKTTFTQLLLRFADIQQGSIAIDGQDIATVTQTSLHESIAYVPQDPFLFHRSLRENIAYGRPDATDAEIIAAARKAHAMEFIDKLPDGLDTVVGERGVKLSGGQRQRIAIARAILKNAPILILDEATSALDSESEQLIQKSLTTLMRGRTSIVVAHRLSTIARLDRIIVLDDGTIVEDGTHATLLKQNGTYAALWSHQSDGFIEE